MHCLFRTLCISDASFYVEKLDQPLKPAGCNLIIQAGSGCVQASEHKRYVGELQDYV